MKNRIKISEFLKTGKFGTVAIGDSAETIMQKLGTPDGYSKINKRTKHIHYGKYEFFIIDGKLDSIQNDHYDPKYPNEMEYENELIKIEVEFLKANKIKLLSEIKTELNKSNISYSLIDYWGRKGLKTSSGVVIDFNDEKEIQNEINLVKIDSIENYELIGIRFFPNTIDLIE